MPVIRNAQVIAVRDTIPGPYQDRKAEDMTALAAVVDPDAARAQSGNGRHDRDDQIAGMLRSRPRRITGSGPVRRGLPVRGNLEQIYTDARGNLLGDDLAGVSTPLLWVAAIAGWYFFMHPEKFDQLKKTVSRKMRA